MADSQDSWKGSLKWAAILVVPALAIFLGLRLLIPPPDPPLSYSFQAPAPGLGRVAAEVSSSYSFITVRGDGRPVRWDPCTPIRYVTNLDFAPSGAALIVEQSLDQVSAATGISFKNEGSTSELPTRDREPYQPRRYGDDWSPLLIAWAYSTTTDIFAQPDALGYGGPTSIAVAGDPRAYVSGMAALNRDAVLPMVMGHGTTWGLVVMHELGHAIGLDHVDDPLQVMYGPNTAFPDSTPVQWGAGDLAGFKLLGRQKGCVKTPRASSVSRLSIPQKSN